MAIRLWYQYPAPLSPFRSVVFQRVLAAIDQVRRPETEVVIMPARQGATSTRQYALELTNLHTAAEVARAVRAAKDESFDGVVIGQSLDPGLFAAKELLDLPVVGILESAVHFAALWGESFGLVTIPTPAGYPPTKYSGNHRRNIERYGLSSKLGGMDELKMSLEKMTSDIQQGHHDEILSRFEDAAKRLYGRGVDVVVAGDTILSSTLIHEGFSVVPSTRQVVVDLVSSGVKMAETMVDFHRSLGIVRSRAGIYALPVDEDLAAILGAFEIDGNVTD